MKLVDHFNTFLTDVVNLNPTRVDLLEESIEALKDVIRSSGWTPKIISFTPQGSWAHKTIIKPVENRAFDADLLVLICPVGGWDPKQYLATLRALFANKATYQDKVRRFSHCVTIEYAGERKIDLAPCVVNRNGLSRFEVCNCETNEFETTEPERFTEWLVQRNAWTGGNSLRKVTRLLKYLRDVKGTFSCPSVLFTTLLASRIVSSENIANFSDLPTALRTIAGRLDDWLQIYSNLPRVSNPVLSSELFSDLWNQERYSNFREKIHTYRGWIDDAFNEPERDESIGKWRRVFGDDFAKNVVIEAAARVSEEARLVVETRALTTLGFKDDLVSLFTRFGRRALPATFDRLPHKQRPQWRPLAPPAFRIQIVAGCFTSRNGAKVKDVQSEDGPLSKHHWLRFQVRTGSGLPLNSEFEIHWRVTNTDKEAMKANCLRGGFELSNEGLSRWEQLEYRGVHTVEAFVIRKRDRVLAAQSDIFYVVID